MAMNVTILNIPKESTRLFIILFGKTIAYAQILKHQRCLNFEYVDIFANDIRNRIEALWNYPNPYRHSMTHSAANPAQHNS